MNRGCERAISGRHLAAASLERRRVVMRRREFIRLLGGATVGGGLVGGTLAFPLAAPAQPARISVIGFITAGFPEAGEKAAAAFRQGLAETGFVEGRNLRIEYRFAQNDRARIPALVADLISLQ